MYHEKEARIHTMFYDRPLRGTIYNQSIMDIGDRKPKATTSTTTTNQQYKYVNQSYYKLV